MSALRARRTGVPADGHDPSRLCVAPCLKAWLVRKVRPQMTEMAKTAVLLVAGVGSRLRPLTDSIPKALVPVGGRSILERAVLPSRPTASRRLFLPRGIAAKRSRRLLGRGESTRNFVSTNATTRPKTRSRYFAVKAHCATRVSSNSTGTCSSMRG